MPFFKEFASGPAVSGFLHSPQSPSGDAIVLAHGAGSNCRQPLLVALCDAFAAAGWLALRCDLPFRQRRATGPPSPAAAALDREGLRRAGEAVRELAGGRIVLGGHSYGGRQASMVAAEDSAAADGLLLTSYPLHPPGRPDKPRTEHLGALRVPALFVHGTRDPFGTPEEMQSAIALISARTALLTIEGAGHDLAYRRGSDLPQRVLSIFTRFYSTAT